MKKPVSSGIALVAQKEKLTPMEQALLSALRQCYGSEQVKVYGSLKRVEDLLKKGIPIPAFVLAAFDGTNSEHVDDVFAMPCFSDGVIKVLAVNADQILSEIQREKFDNHDMIRFSEKQYEFPLESQLRTVFEEPYHGVIVRRSESSHEIQADRSSQVH